MEVGMVKRAIKATAFLAALPAVAGVMVLMWWLKRRQELDFGDVSSTTGTLKDDYIEIAEIPQETEVIDIKEDEPEAIEPDDLKRIEGIGPKISNVLQEAGITNFTQLAKTDVVKIEEYLRDASIGANPDTWPEQAGYAAKGDWEALESFQKELSGGRRA
jgi:predicted flap endonuclease-1-like 5' DNA nuclease